MSSKDENDDSIVTFRGVRRMIKKIVKAQGTTGRVYLPAEEVGDEAIILFLDKDD
jgi:hypothetical protein